MKKISAKAGEKLDMFFLFLLVITIFIIRFILKSEQFLLPMAIIIGVMIVSTFFREKTETKEMNFPLFYLGMGIFFLFFQFLSSSSVLWLGIVSSLSIFGLLYAFFRMNWPRKISRVSKVVAIIVALGLFFSSVYIVEGVQRMVIGSWVEGMGIDREFYDNRMNRDAEITDFYKVITTAQKPTNQKSVLLKDENGKKYEYHLDEGNHKDVYFYTIDGIEVSYKLWAVRGDAFGDASNSGKAYGFVQRKDDEPLHEIPEKWAKWLVNKQ